MNSYTKRDMLSLNPVMAAATLAGSAIVGGASGVVLADKALKSFMQGFWR